MKKILICLFSLGICLSLTGCGNSNTDKNSPKNLSDILKNNEYNLITEGYYQKTDSYGSYYLFSINEKTITYNNAEEDYQIEYNWTDNTAWEYGCKYHYDNNTTTNDGEGMGECDEETINQLVEGKKNIDDELKKLNLTINDLK